ncbi:hypothetical protein [Streptomyces sp. NPDC006368]|uniref:hypothetical protein n=1 Tax=Streptomyces sp. NPDC006368 TaxID=3156760 RepID=UPI0033B77A6C
MTRADALIAVTPVSSASYSGLLHGTGPRAGKHEEETVVPFEHQLAALRVG